ncbi:MAG: proteasome activator [Egibacteraceae bacterium]
MSDDTQAGELAETEQGGALRESTAGPDGEVELVEEGDERGLSGISEPGKLMRIALMLRQMQEEVRLADTDEAGRERLRRIHDRSLKEMCDVLSGDLRDELAALTLPFDDTAPSESEIRIAQAQLIGWLEGLFQGIQAAIYNQQLAARQQLDQIRRPGLPPGMQPQREDGRGQGTGQYL